MKRSFALGLTLVSALSFGAEKKLTQVVTGDMGGEIAPCG